MNCYPYYTDFLEIVKKAADHSDLQPTPDLFFLSDFYQNLNIFRSVSDQIFKALLGQCI